MTVLLLVAEYVKFHLTPASHMEVGCPGTWGLELLTPIPGGKSTPKACPTCNPATGPARHTQPQPKHPSHRARSSVEIIITVITNNNNNNNVITNTAAWLAQGVERQTAVQEVEGSSPRPDQHSES